MAKVRRRNAMLFALSPSHVGMALAPNSITSTAFFRFVDWEYSTNKSLYVLVIVLIEKRAGRWEDDTDTLAMPVVGLATHKDTKDSIDASMDLFPEIYAVIGRTLRQLS